MLQEIAYCEGATKVFAERGYAGGGMGQERIVFQRKDRIAVVTINEAEATNSLNASALCRLDDILYQIVSDEEVSVVVIAGTDNAFVGDTDTNEIPDFDTQRAWEPVIDKLGRLGKPSIAPLNGDVIGRALELAMACDIRIGTEGGRFGLPRIREGRIPSNGGTQRLARLVGQGRALEMILTGELIDAAEALRIGLINRMVPPTSLMETAMTLAREMASKSPLAMSYVKEALYQGMDLTLDQWLRMELDLYLLLFTTRDRIEGITAFKEKRAPKFEGI